MDKKNNIDTTIMPAEWQQQEAVLLAWPHSGTDWNYMLDEVQACFKRVAQAIVSEMKLIVVAPRIGDVKRQLNDIDNGNIIYLEIDTNDTWARDFGPISVFKNGIPFLLDFKFNAWGMKFAACHDNQVNLKMALHGIFKAQMINYHDFVLEGGSIESDGNGTILTTSHCLLSPNRNDSMNKEEIEHELKLRLGAKKVLWLNSGELVGDDTDAHIDTLARLAPCDTILYVKCDDASDEQFESLQHMETELKRMTNAQGKPFNLVPLPCPTPIRDVDGQRLPATYANFLITNKQVLVPIYGQEGYDNKALEVVQGVFPERKVVGIDCNALIKQHGSLHCITMQIPQNFLKI